MQPKSLPVYIGRGLVVHTILRANADLSKSQEDFSFFVEIVSVNCPGKGLTAFAEKYILILYHNNFEEDVHHENHFHPGTR